MNITTDQSEPSMKDFANMAVASEVMNYLVRAGVGEAALLPPFSEFIAALRIRKELFPGHVLIDTTIEGLLGKELFDQAVSVTFDNYKAVREMEPHPGVKHRILAIYARGRSHEN